MRTWLEVFAVKSQVRRVSVTTAVAAMCPAGECLSNSIDPAFVFLTRHQAEATSSASERSCRTAAQVDDCKYLATDREHAENEIRNVWHLVGRLHPQDFANMLHWKGELFFQFGR